MIKSFKNFYRKRFTGQLFIIKAGGRVITDDKARRNLLQNIEELTSDGIKVLLIFGGGHAIDDGIKEAGLKTTKIDGRRITSGDDIAVVKKVLGGDLAYRISQTMKQIGLEGYVCNTVPSGWMTTRRKPKKAGITRFDGDIIDVDKKNIKKFFQTSGFTACPCLTTSESGLTLNTNADNAAISLAIGTKAAKLILLTDVDGVRIGNKYASFLTGSEIDGLIADGTVTGGMQVKLENCRDAVRAGVKRVHILNGFKKDALRNEVYTSKGTGTMILRRREMKTYEFELNPDKKKRKTA